MVIHSVGHGFWGGDSCCSFIAILLDLYLQVPVELFLGPLNLGSDSIFESLHSFFVSLTTLSLKLVLLSRFGSPLSIFALFLQLACPISPLLSLLIVHIPSTSTLELCRVVNLHVVATGILTNRADFCGELTKQLDQLCSLAFLLPLPVVASILVYFKKLLTDLHQVLIDVHIYIIKVIFLA